jgi:hypothetical protein
MLAVFLPLESKPQILLNRQVKKERPVLWHMRNTQSGPVKDLLRSCRALTRTNALAARSFKVSTLQFNSSSQERNKPRDSQQSGGLSNSVSPEQRDNLTGTNCQIKSVHHG